MGIKAEEFNLKKRADAGGNVRYFSPPACHFAMNAAKPMHEAAAALGVDPLYTALPSYVVIMGGGALVNLGFCFYSPRQSEGFVAKSRLLTGKNRLSSATFCFPHWAG